MLVAAGTGAVAPRQNTPGMEGVDDFGAVQARYRLCGCRAWCSIDRERIFSKGDLGNLQQRGLLTLVGDLAFHRDLGVNAHGWWVLPSSHPLQGMEAQSTGCSGTGFYCYNTNVATYLSKTGNNPKSKGIWISKQASVSAQECCKSRISWIPFLNNLISLFIYIYTQYSKNPTSGAQDEVYFP